MVGKCRFNPSVHWQKGDRLVHARVLHVCDNVSHLSITQTGTLIILSDQFFWSNKTKPSHALKSTNEIRRHKACVYYLFVNKDGGQLE